mmetsp:Transcript_133025/g.384753  ORF Transcript_133025/g.384753 Transcript_133025/m.384753 type:complete len:263 (-) Transcript_133025:902-1690(-)
MGGSSTRRETRAQHRMSQVPGHTWSRLIRAHICSGTREAISRRSRVPLTMSSQPGRRPRAVLLAASSQPSRRALAVPPPTSLRLGRAMSRRLNPAKMQRLPRLMKAPRNVGDCVVRGPESHLQNGGSTCRRVCAVHGRCLTWSPSASCWLAPSIFSLRSRCAGRRFGTISILKKATPTQKLDTTRLPSTSVCSKSSRTQHSCWRWRSASLVRAAVSSGTPQGAASKSSIVRTLRSSSHARSMRSGPPARMASLSSLRSGSSG